MDYTGTALILITFVAWGLWIGLLEIKENDHD